jgi:hypothetical protein
VAPNRVFVCCSQFHIKMTNIGPSWKVNIYIYFELFSGYKVTFVFLCVNVQGSSNGTSVTMGLLISCYDSCCRPKIANGESINPYASVNLFWAFLPVSTLNHMLQINFFCRLSEDSRNKMFWGRGKCEMKSVACLFHPHQSAVLLEMHLS